MTLKKISLPLAALLVLSGMSLTHAMAASLLLDFGPATVLPADALRSPGHAIGAIPTSEISWNKIVSDTNTLAYSDGTAATGVSIDLGRSVAGVDTVDFNDNGFNPGLAGSALTGGVYANTSPVRDGVFPGGAGVNNLAMGLRINGLAAGTYTIYVVGRNSNSGNATPERFYAANGATATTFPFSLSNSNVVLANSSPAITNGFMQGDNFGALTVTIATGESIFVACEGTTATELRGFFNAIEVYAGVPILSARVTAQPQSKSVYEGVTVTFNPAVSGNAPVTNQWRFNGNNLADGPNVIGANSSSLTLVTVSGSAAGNYSLSVSNAFGSDLSSNAVLTVNSILNTAQMSNTWNLLVGQRPYLGIGSTERGLAYNPLTTNLLLVSRMPAESVIVLDAQTGAEKHFLDVTGIPASTGGLSLGLNTIGVADDGVVYGAGLTISAQSPPLNIFRWPDDSSNNAPILVFAGDPGAGVQPNLRWGDYFIVRGSGPDTQMLLSPGTGTNVVLLRSTSGMDFQTEIPPAVISITGVPSAFAQLGIAFGPGTNTFWAKSGNNALYLIQFDLATLTGFVLNTFPTTVVPGSVRGIAVDSTQKFLAGVSVEGLGDNVRLYDVSNLTTGPLLRDQETFSTQNPNINGNTFAVFGGNYLFALDCNNGIKAFVLNTNYVPPSVAITTQPLNQTVPEGLTATFSTVIAGMPPLFFQWRFNGTNLTNSANIVGATSNVLTLRSITTNLAGSYSLFVSNNSFATTLSSNAVLTVTPNPLFNTAQMSNIWNVFPGDRIYLGTNNTERGMAYNPATTNLLVVSRSPSESVAVLDAKTGAEKNFLDVTGIPTTTPGVSLGINTIGVSDDGVVFASSVTISSTSPPFNIYRWPNDNSNNAPALVFAGDPAAVVDPNRRYTDYMTVRGSGSDIQILVSPGTGTNVILLRTTSGLDFQTEIPPAIIAVDGVPSSFAQYGLAFGPGTNTFWAKTVNNALYLIQFDLASNTGTVLHSYSNSLPASFRAISVSKDQKFLAGITRETSVNVHLYDVSDLSSDPILRDQEAFATFNPNGNLGGATAIGGNYVFALESNSGLKAFLIDTNFVPPVTSFSITSIVQSDGSVIFTWSTLSGHNYQVQAKDSLSTPGWGNLGGPITATGSTLSFTNSTAGSSTRFYRIVGQ